MPAVPSQSKSPAGSGGAWRGPGVHALEIRLNFRSAIAGRESARVDAHFSCEGCARDLGEQVFKEDDDAQFLG